MGKASNIVTEPCTVPGTNILLNKSTNSLWYLLLNSYWGRKERIERKALFLPDLQMYFWVTFTLKIIFL